MFFCFQFFRKQTTVLQRYISPMSWIHATCCHIMALTFCCLIAFYYNLIAFCCILSSTKHFVFSMRLWIGNHWWNVRIFINKKITKPFLEKYFWPADSKSLRQRSAAFEMQLSHGAWGSSFKRHPTVCAKNVLVSSDEVHKQLFTIHRIFFKQPKW